MPKLLSPKLMQSIPFTVVELEINRRLQLSAEQQQLLQPKFEIYIGISTFISAFCFFVGTAILFFGIRTQMLLFMVFFCILGFSFCFYWAFWSIQKQSQLKKYRGVQIAEGKPDYNISYRRNHWSQEHEFDVPVYSMKVGNAKLFVNEMVYDLIKGNEIRVYYFQTLTKKVILSVEEVS